MSKKKDIKKGEKKEYIRFGKKSSIIFLSVFAILMVLAYVFAFVPVELGTTDYHAFVSEIKLGLDLEGGVYASYDAVRPTDATEEEYKSSVEGTVNSLQNLLFSKGYTEAQVTLFNNGNSIRVEVPNADDDDEIFELISKPKKLEFFETDQNANKVDPSGKALLTGSYLTSASVGYDSSEQKYLIRLKFNNQGAAIFKQVTTDLNGKYMGIFLGGTNIVNATVNETISNGEAVISGNYTYDTAYQTAIQIQSGALPIQLNMRESGNIGATLGTSAKTDGLIAGIVGIILIIIFMCVRYRLLGVAASLSLVFFTITYLFFMSIFPWVQLTLPGIAGILLAIGMAVDANVIIFERTREERASGKTLLDSVNSGFKNSYSAILDGNVTTIIGAVVLILLATASIKGFAITLLIGIVISLVSSLIVTRLMLKAIMALTRGVGMDDEKLDKLYGTKKNSAKYSLLDVQLSDTGVVAVEETAKEAE